uniref:Uncharacterized protein n=1 Tax=Acrobeloides nanus TaxID=290746 RepID=A0A914EIG7_9BILA
MLLYYNLFIKYFIAMLIFIIQISVFSLPVSPDIDLEYFSDSDADYEAIEKLVEDSKQAPIQHAAPNQFAVEPIYWPTELPDAKPYSPISQENSVRDEDHGAIDEYQGVANNSVPTVVNRAKVEADVVPADDPYLVNFMNSLFPHEIETNPIPNRGSPLPSNGAPNDGYSDSTDSQYKATAAQHQIETNQKPLTTVECSNPSNKCTTHVPVTNFEYPGTPDGYEVPTDKANHVPAKSPIPLDGYDSGGVSDKYPVPKKPLPNEYPIPPNSEYLVPKKLLPPNEFLVHPGPIPTKSGNIKPPALPRPSDFEYSDDTNGYAATAGPTVPNEDTGSVGPVAVQIDSDNEYPVPIDSDSGYPRPIDSDTGYPLPIDSDTGYPLPIDSDTGYPAPIDDDTGYPAPVDDDTGYPPDLHSSCNRQDRCCLDCGNDSLVIDTDMYLTPNVILQKCYHM